MVLQHAEQLALRIDRHLGNFIEQQRTALGLAEQTFTVGMRTGERTFDGTEEFTLDQFAGQRRAVDLDDPVFGART